MLKQMNWETVYKLWRHGCYQFSNILSSPVNAETIFVEYKQDGYIYGYDWLENTDIPARKQLSEKNPLGFLLFSKPSNKGTIQTAEMLIDAQTEEELAAIWIAATAKELSEYRINNGIARYSDMLHIAACSFLRNRYYLWHHAMKRLVMALIQLNTMLLKNSWSILRYSSLSDENFPESHYRIDSV